MCVVCGPQHLQDERVRATLANHVPTVLIQGEGLAALAATTEGADLVQWCTDCSSHEFMALPPVQDENGNVPNIGDEFNAFCKQCVPGPPCLPPLIPGSYFVSLTFPDISSAVTMGRNWKPPAWVAGRGTWCVVVQRDGGV